MPADRVRVLRSAAFALAVLVSSACAADDLVLPSDGAPARIDAIQGDDQEGIVGAPLDDPLVVRVTDAQGRPVPNATVEFVVQAGANGEVAPERATTDGEGLASASWVLGRTPGEQRARAAVGQLAVTFTAVAAAGNGSRLQAAGGQGQRGRAGERLADPLVVRVVDQFGNPVPGVRIAWSVTGGGSVSATSTTTGDDGRTSVTRTLGGTPGTQTTRAAGNGVDGSPVTFTHEATAGEPARLERVSGDGQRGERGKQLADPLVVRVVDGAGNGVAGQAVTWVVGAGGGSASPATSTTDGNGRASTRWTLGSVSGSQSLNAVVSGVGVVTFTATASGGGGGGGGDDDDDEPVRLAFVTQPRNVEKNERFDPVVRVAVHDARGRVVDTDDVQIRLELVNGRGRDRLRGNMTRRTSDGIATFEGLRVDGEGEGYRLRATAQGLEAALSAPFDVEND